MQVKYLLLLIIAPFMLNAQAKQIKKIEDYYNSGDYSTLLEKNQKYLNKYNEPLFYYYQSFANFQLFKTTSDNIQKNRNYNNSLMYLGYAYQKDRNNEYKDKFSDIIQEIKDSTLAIGKREYQKDKKSSEFYFKKLAQLFKDTTDEYIDLFVPKTPAMLQVLAFNNYNGKINQTDENGKKQGLWIEKYDNGVVKYEIEFKDGHPAGVFRKYYKTGILSADMFFDNQGVRAAAILYDETGNKKSMGYFYNKKRDSLWQFFLNDSIVISEITYSRGIKNGPERVYSLYSYPNYAMERFWKNGKLDSTYMIAYPNGQPKFLAKYKNNMRNGDYATFDQTGKAIVVGQYVNDLRVGEWKFWDSKNHKYIKINYKEGLPENYEELTDEETKIINEWEKKKGEYEEPSTENIYQYGNEQ